MRCDSNRSSAVEDDRTPASSSSPDDYRWLVGPDGGRWLERVAAQRQPLPVWAARLRKELSAERTHLILEQVELRERGRAKFAAAAKMFFTRKGLEQATDEHVAAYKAQRFADRALSVDRCCGIGGDLLALAGRGPAVGVERDPAVAVLAEANLAVLQCGHESFHTHRVAVADAAEFTLADCQAWHADPDRRPASHRTTRIELGEPGVETLDRLRAQCANAAIKLAPATEVPQAWAHEAELEWIARDRQCRQQVAWFGQLAKNAGQRRATVVHVACDGSASVRSIVGQSDQRFPVAAAIGRYVFEPEAAVLAAGLSGVLAAEHALQGVAPGIMYLTGDAPVSDLALSAFEVTDMLPFDVKRLRRLLAERGVGILEIKKRGVPDDPEMIRRQLRLNGEHAAVLLLAPIGGRVTAIVGQRLPCQRARE